MKYNPRVRHIAILVTILCLPWLSACTEADAWNTVFYSGGVEAAGGTPGEIGTTTTSSNATTFANRGYISTFTTTTAGTVQYGHLHINTSDGTETVCLSLQADSDGGTVHLSGSGTAPASGWLNVDMGSGFTLVAATDYRLQVNPDDPITLSTGTYVGAGETQEDIGFGYNCGSAMTEDGSWQGRDMTIIFDNSAGDPS